MKHRSERGSVLISVIVVLMLCSMAGLALTLTLQDYSIMMGKDRDELQGFYAAEAGALEVVSWFNTSGTAVADVAPTLSPLFVRNEENEYAALAAALPTGGLDIAHQYASLLPVLRDSRGNLRGEVAALKIFPPSDFPEALAKIPYLICVVRSDGRAAKGSTKRVDLYLAYHNLKLDGVPGVILSRAAIDISGNCKAHWGEVWSRANLELPNKSQTPTELQDPWLKFRAEGKLEFGNTWKVPKWGKPYHTSPNGDIVDGTNYPGKGVTYSNIADYDTMLEQNQVLDWPVYDYEEVKWLAKAKGRYYSTDAAGYVYRDGIEDTAHRVTNYQELNVAGSRSDWTNVDYDVVFVDTIDGNPPASDGSNMTTLRLSGGGGDWSWKGFYYLCLNLDVSGMGQPSPIPVKNPAGAWYTKNAFMDGILCVQGTYEGSGNEVIYGSLYSGKGFVGTGTPDVWYNVDLRNGMPFPIQSYVELAMWKVEK